MDNTFSKFRNLFIFIWVDLRLLISFTFFINDILTSSLGVVEYFWLESQLISVLSRHITTTERTSSLRLSYWFSDSKWLMFSVELIMNNFYINILLKILRQFNLPLIKFENKLPVQSGSIVTRHPFFTSTSGNSLSIKYQ